MFCRDSAVVESNGRRFSLLGYLGLRRTELNRLKRGDFELDGPRPIVRILGTVSKNSNAAVVDIPAAAMPALRLLLTPDMAPFAHPFFSRVPRMNTMRQDFAGAEVIYQSEGRRFDFHSRRLTLCTHLRLGDVSKRRAMAIMRLSSKRLLDHIHFDDSQLSLADDMKKLPSFGFLKAEFRASDMDLPR